MHGGAKRAEHRAKHERTVLRSKNKGTKCTECVTYLGKYNIKGGGVALAACRGKACEAPSEAKPVRQRPL